MASNFLSPNNKKLHSIYYVVRFLGENTISLVHKNLMLHNNFVRWPTDPRLPNSAIIEGNLGQTPTHLQECEIMYSTGKLRSCRQL